MSIPTRRSWSCSDGKRKAPGPLGSAPAGASVFTLQVKTLYYSGITSTISAKGQITVPKAVRDELGLRPGTRVEFELTALGVLLRKGHPRGIRAVDRVLGILTREASTDVLVDDMRGRVPASYRTSWLGPTHARGPMPC